MYICGGTKTKEMEHNKLMAIYTAANFKSDYLEMASQLFEQRRIIAQKIVMNNGDISANDREVLIQMLNSTTEQLKQVLGIY